MCESVAPKLRVHRFQEDGRKVPTLRFWQLAQGNTARLPGYVSSPDRLSWWTPPENAFFNLIGNIDNSSSKTHRGKKGTEDLSVINKDSSTVLRQFMAMGISRIKKKRQFEKTPAKSLFPLKNYFDCLLQDSCGSHRILHTGGWSKLEIFWSSSNKYHSSQYTWRNFHTSSLFK